MKKLLLFASIAVIFLSGCSKDDDAPACTLNAGSFAGTYKITAATYQSDSSAPVEDDYADWDPCEKDDIYVFNTNGSFSFSEGATQCDPPTESVAGTWSLSGSVVTINVTIAGQSVPIPLPIENFNCSSFKITDVDSSTGEITVSTFTKQ